MEQGCSSEGEVEQLKAIVEEILANSLGKDTFSYARQFRGLLSTEPDKVDSYVTSRSLYGMCGTIAPALCTQLIKHGINAILVYGKAHSHVYVQVGSKIIDPTIGQFIEGHNSVFVGTADELQRIVIESTGNGKPYQLVNTRSRNNPTEALERIWGVS